MAGNAQAEGPWDWLRRSALEVGCALVFARDIEQDEMFEAFGLDPTAARSEKWAFDPNRARVRVGRVDSWTFAVDEHMVSLDLATHGKNIGKRLSAGTEVVMIEWTPKPTEHFEYWADGVQVASFEPYRAFDRYGSEPDRFLREMRQTGMVTETGGDDDSPPGDDLIAVLDMAALALGIWLSEEAVMGPLATVMLPDSRSSDPVIRR